MKMRTVKIGLGWGRGNRSIPVIRVYDKAILKPVNSATETS